MITEKFGVLIKNSTLCKRYIYIVRNIYDLKKGGENPPSIRTVSMR